MSSYETPTPGRSGLNPQRTSQGGLVAGDDRSSFPESSTVELREAEMAVQHAGPELGIASSDAVPVEDGEAREQTQFCLEGISFDVPEAIGGCGRYQLDQEFSRGAMGAIYRGFDTHLGREVALKFLLNEHRNNPELRERFLQEARITSRLQHPGVLPVYDLHRAAGNGLFFTMMFVHGVTLKELLKERATASSDLSRFLTVFERICQTMAYVHAQGVIHRDLKPSNIMVGEFGVVRVMDWGPPDFGHIKPDVAANGEDVLSTTANGFYEYQSGTSMAAPTVTGALGLLVELLQRQLGDDYEPSAALLKALIIAGTDDLGPMGPDYRHGWGQVNARKSAEIIALNGASGGQHIRRVLVQNGVNGSFIIKAKGGEKLIATAVWLDLPGTWVAPQKDPLGVLPTVNQSQSVLKNDIDLKITRSTTSWHPPSLNPAPFTTLAPNTYPPDTFGLPTYSGPNHRDTVEKIIIPQPGSAQSTPTAGHDYTITYGPAPGVTLRNELGQAAPQEMFIVLSGIQVQGTPPFQIVWFEETADDEVTLLWASIPGSTYWVQYSDSLVTGSWTDIGGSSLVATTTFAARTVPTNPTGSQRFYRIRKAT